MTAPTDTLAGLDAFARGLHRGAPVNMDKEATRRRGVSDTPSGEHTTDSGSDSG